MSRNLRQRHPSCRSLLKLLSKAGISVCCVICATNLASRLLTELTKLVVELTELIVALNELSAVL